MKFKRIFALLLSLLLALSVLSGCGSQESPAPESTAAPEQPAEAPAEAATRIITDMAGREVEIPAEINSIICMGAMVCREVCYLDAAELVIGTEEMDGKCTTTNRDYAYVHYEDFKDLPVIAKGGGISYRAYPEQIVMTAPDIILTSYNDESIAQLEGEVDIPIVAVRNPFKGFINEAFYDSMRFIADVLGRQERCEELLSYVDECKEDLTERSSGIAEEDKPSAYTGAVTFSGGHGFAGTSAFFGPFEAIGAKNVVDETGEQGCFEVDLEKVSVWDPDYIFLDPGNMSLVNDEYAKNPGFFDSLSAVKNGNIYTMPSYNSYSQNITYIIIDAYFAGSVLYPDRFEDIDLKAKGNEVLERFLGRPFFEDMERDGYFYGKLTLGN